MGIRGWAVLPYGREKSWCLCYSDFLQSFSIYKYLFFGFGNTFLYFTVNSYGNNECKQKSMSSKMLCHFNFSRKLMINMYLPQNLCWYLPLTMGATVISLNTRRPETATKPRHLLQKLGVILRTHTTSASMITIYSVKFDFAFRSNFLLFNSKLSCAHMECEAIAVIPVPLTEDFQEHTNNTHFTCYQIL